MSNAVAMAPSAVDPQIAAAMELKLRIDPLRNSLGLGDFTEEEVSLFAMIAQRMRLDPFQRQIFAIKRKGKVTFQVGIDGFRSRAEETGQYRGSDEPVYGAWVEKPYPHPESATVVVHRQVSDGSMVHQSSTAWWDEYVITGDQGFNWQKMPRVMLAKCAEAAAFRKAFPQVFGGVYEPAEMDQDREAAAQARPVGQTAAEKAQARLAAVTAPAAPPHEPVAAPQASGEVESSVLGASAPSPAIEVAPQLVQCEATSPYEGAAQCRKAAGHDGMHKSTEQESWR